MDVRCSGGIFMHLRRSGLLLATPIFADFYLATLIKYKITNFFKSLSSTGRRKAPVLPDPGRALSKRSHFGRDSNSLKAACWMGEGSGHSSCVRTFANSCALRKLGHSLLLVVEEGLLLIRASIKLSNYFLFY